jgi:hypothetical protein
MNAHHDLTWTGLKIGDIFQLHDFRTAELVDTDSFHHFLLRKNPYRILRRGDQVCMRDRYGPG